MLHIKQHQGSGMYPVSCCSDANEANLLVDDARRSVVGIIDWQDCCWGWRVAEVAVAMAYILLLCHDDAEPLQAAANVQVRAALQLLLYPVHACKSGMHNILTC